MKTLMRFLSHPKILSRSGARRHRPGWAVLVLSLSASAAVQGQADVDKPKPRSAMQSIATLRKTIAEGPHGEVPIRQLFGRYTKTSGPSKRPVALALLIRKQETLPILLDILERGSWGERFNALLFLQKVGRWKEASEQVLSLLDNPDVDWEIRLRAAATSAVLGIQEASEPLATLLANSDREGMRAVCAQCLGRLGGPRATLDVLRQALSDRSARVQIAAAGALGRLGSDAGMNVLLKQSDADHWALRMRAAEALGLVGTAEAAGRLRELNSDSVVDVRSSSMVGLLRIETDKMTPDARVQRLSNLLSHRNQQVAVWAAAQLAERHRTAALPAIVKTLSSATPSVRMALEFQLLRISEEEN